MEKIKRPIKVPRAEQAILTDKNFQANVKEQFETIYDYLDTIANNFGSGGNTDINLLYPVGRGFIDFTDTDYSNYLGFTWERELIGMFPVGYNPNDTEFNKIGKTGGEKEHLLKTAELPTNIGSVKIPTNNDTGSTHTGDFVVSGGSSGTRTTKTINVTNSEAQTAFSIIPPYKVVSYWKRIA